MEINEEEAWTVFAAMDTNHLHDRELRLRQRIKKEFPAIDEKMKNPAASRRVSISIYQPLRVQPCGKPQGIHKIKRLKRRNYLWEMEVEEDESIKKIRAEMEELKRNCHSLPWGMHGYNIELEERYALIDVLLEQKAEVLNKLMKKGEKNE